MCEYCKRVDVRNQLQDIFTFGEPINYCPVCGEHLNITEFFKAWEDVTCDDGLEGMELVRLPSKPPEEKTKYDVSKPMSMVLNTDNIDISRELKLLTGKDERVELLARKYYEIFMKNMKDDEDR